MTTISTTTTTTIRMGIFLLLSVFCLQWQGTKAIGDETFQWSTGVMYPDKEAAVGDTYTFEFSPTSHNLNIHPSGTCEDQTDFIRLDSQSYTFQESDLGETLFFACQVGSHCSGGQNMRVTVVDVDTNTTDTNSTSGDDDDDDNGGDDDDDDDSSETIQVTWTIPSGDSLQAVTAAPGDVIVFNFASGDHNVYKHPSGTCVQDGSELVGEQGGGATTYTITDADAGTTITFACHVGSHCDQGQIMNVTVSDDVGGDDDDDDGDDESSAATWFLSTWLLASAGLSAIATILM